MKASVFVGTSLDGFIARQNGAFDFLPPGGGEPHGYDEFMASVDVLVIGRNTLNQVLTFETWPYASKRVVALTNRPLDLCPNPPALFEIMHGRPREIMARLSETGATHAYVDGGKTVQDFLREGLIDRLVITRVPVLIGEGIPLFGALPRDIVLRHLATTAYASGLVKSEYEVRH
ncbi:MAG: dihydrofolate reductase family protein [Burkholderiaceae bacterium]|jgi:dihydrofolate reductase